MKLWFSQKTYCFLHLLLWRLYCYSHSPSNQSPSGFSAWKCTNLRSHISSGSKEKSHLWNKRWTERIYLSWHLASDIHALLNLISNFEISWKIHCKKALSYICKEEFKERKKIYFEGKRFTFRRYLKLFVGKSAPLIWVSMVLELV